MRVVVHVLVSARVLRWTAQRIRIWAGVLRLVAAMVRMIEFFSRMSSSCAMPNSMYDDAPNAEKAVTRIPASRANRTRLVCVFCGCSSTCNVDGRMRHVLRICRRSWVEKLQTPISTILPESTNASMALHVAHMSLGTTTILPSRLVHSGGYLSLMGTYSIEIGKWMRYSSTYTNCRSASVLSNANCTCSGLWYVFHSLDVMKSS
mmetsp:Transcript_9265/g.25055  ORF Transcript_9265/g.25055 Transcript_9265/m.25055 type:complete len:205 (-) Transcript_9265:1291-1905(-)